MGTAGLIRIRVMRTFDSSLFDHRLYTGFCALNEADYLDTIAKDIDATRIAGFGRRANLGGDFTTLLSLTRKIRKFKPHVMPNHTAKAVF